jgi:uncharacterized SAM-binding protein YcdF (DUF218 family)
MTKSNHITNQCHHLMNLTPKHISWPVSLGYHHVNHPWRGRLHPGAGQSTTPGLPNGAPELLLAGYAPWLVFSGGLGRLTEGLWTEPEADTFARIARGMGVPAEQILTENRSTNTGENIALSYGLLQKHGIAVRRMILVQKPYMERRAYATFLKQWPGDPVELMVTSPQLSFDDYPNAEVPLEHVIHIMVGDMQRIRVYAEKGFQVPQDIPAEVWAAYEGLVA